MDSSSVLSDNPSTFWHWLESESLLVILHSVLLTDERTSYLVKLRNKFC